MVDLSILESKGVTSDRLKEIFTVNKPKAADAAIADKIRARIRDRIQAGISYNINNYRHWYACDVAWDVPFRQTTYSLVRGMMDRNIKPEDIVKTLEDVDLTEMITAYDKSGKILTGRINKNDIAEVKVDAPAFFHIYIPLAKAYTTIRAAAIINSYRQVPLFQYEAAKSTSLNRLKSEIITDRVEMMSTQYGYFDVIKQAVMHMLHYSTAVLFPTEEWHSVKQLVKDETGTEEKVIKEGVRFNIPHPSRVFVDTAYRPSTINSDTGVNFGAYWCIVRYSEVNDNPLYWNTDKISTGITDWIAQSPGFFNTVYSSCALRFSTITDADRGDREARSSVYTASDKDRAVTLIQYFEKINPKKAGIGDYDYDVWFRFVVAGNDTVLYAAPLPYCPMVYFGYDALETRATNSSMTLEILPFQDHISNLFSQYLLTMKQNLTNLNFFDINQVDKATVDSLRSLGHRAYSERNFMPMDMRANRIGGQNNVAEAFQSFTFEHQPTDGLVEGVRELLNILERVLVISPQELAQTASHELTAEEVRNMNDAKSTRYEFTAASVDRGVYALKVLLYEALMSYAEPELYARLASPVSEEDLKKLGFEVEHSDHHSTLVKGDKTAISIESFASVRDGDLRVNSPQVAASMVQLLQAITSNQALLNEVGGEQVISLINEIAAIGGLPRDFRFTPTGNTQQAQAQALQQQVEQLAQKIEQSAVSDVAQNLKPIFESQKQKFDTIEGQLQQLMALIKPPMPPPQAAPPPNVAPIQNPPNIPTGGPVAPMAGPPGGPALPPGVGGPVGPV